MTFLRKAVPVLAAAGLLAACDGGGGPPGPERTLSILSGSENRSLEPIVADFCADEGWACPMSYSGSVDIMLALQDGALGHDAVWPAHSRWVELGDRERRVKHLESIMQTPVVFAITDEHRQRLGLDEGEVTTRDLVRLTEAGELEFLMTSATQSNSGFSAYIAMLTTLAGSPEVLTEDMLESERLREDVRTLLGGVARTSGSSGWLRDLYLNGAETGAYYAMFNYEALIIEANRELEARGLPVLHVIYPADGLAVADSPLGFVARPDDPDSAGREAFFQRLQAHLLSDEVQAELLALGRRTGFGGTVRDADPDVFRPEWGLDTESVLPAIRFPAPDTIREALALYQAALRRPSLLGLCLDFSGSMDGLGADQLKEAIRQLFDPATSERYLLQATDQDVFVAIPFSSEPWQVMIAEGPQEAVALAERVQRLPPHGGTDMYACAREMIARLRSRPEAATHTTAMILMTDGRSDGDPAAFRQDYQRAEIDIPIFAITFGDADQSQLEDVADWTRARVFDGRDDLTRAFRHARGYN